MPYQIKPLTCDLTKIKGMSEKPIVEQLRFFFSHFWAGHDPTKRGQGLTAALAHINFAKS